MAKKGQRCQPPVFHYGLAFNGAFIDEMAKRHELYITKDGRPDRMNTIKNVFRFIERGAGITAFTLYYRVIYDLAGYRGKCNIMTVISNYPRLGKLDVGRQENRAALIEDCQKLQEFLNLPDFLNPPEKLGWYLDLTDGYWGRRAPFVRA